MEQDPSEMRGLIRCIWDLQEWSGPFIHHTDPCRDTEIVCLNAAWHVWNLKAFVCVVTYKSLDCQKDELCFARYCIYICSYVYISVDMTMYIYNIMYMY